MKEKLVASAEWFVDIYILTEILSNEKSNIKNIRNSVFSLVHTKFAVVSVRVRILALKESCVAEQHEKISIVPALNVCVSFFPFKNKIQ